jgi:hypothetical protein
VDGTWADEVCKEKEVAPHSLGAQDHQTHKWSRLTHLEEGE